MYVVSMTTNPDRLPRKFHRQADDSIVCPHRDVSCCEDCIVDHKNLRPMLGVVYWMTDAEAHDFLNEIGDAKFIAEYLDNLVQMHRRHGTLDRLAR
jgi:hypothetical protein